MREQMLEGYRLLNARQPAAFVELIRAVYAADAETIEPGGRKGLEEALQGWSHCSTRSTT